MAVKIRLKRMGKKKQPFYRIVICDSDKSRNGSIVQAIGCYDPLKSIFELNEESAISWLQKGAVPTPTVKNIFKSKGINKKFHELKYGKKS